MAKNQSQSVRDDKIKELCDWCHLHGLTSLLISHFQQKSRLLSIAVSVRWAQIGFLLTISGVVFHKWTFHIHNFLNSPKLADTPQIKTNFSTQIIAAGCAFILASIYYLCRCVFLRKARFPFGPLEMLDELNDQEKIFPQDRVLAITNTEEERAEMIESAKLPIMRAWAECADDISSIDKLRKKYLLASFLFLIGSYTLLLCTTHFILPNL